MDSRLLSSASSKASEWKQSTTLKGLRQELELLTIEADRQRMNAEPSEPPPSLAAFVQMAWPIIEPSKPFVPGRHIDAICQHLEAVSDGRIKRLLINMPPRHAKSSIVSVMWPVWSWITQPSLRWLCASYALSLSIRDNRKCRLLIQSPWFQAKYGNIFQLSGDQNVKGRFENDHMGTRYAVSTGAATTGEGGDILLVDDLHSIDEQSSDVVREAAIEWFRDTWSTRLNDAQTGAMCVVGQRIHEKDVSGWILEESGEEWVHLNLPSEFEPAEKCVTYVNGEKFWEDWRTLEGELLWEDRFPREVIERAKRRHGPMGYAALHQQRPTPAGGGTFKVQHERLFTHDLDRYFLHTPRGVKSVYKEDCQVFLSVDPAISEKQTADYCVAEVWVQTPTKDLLLLHVLRGRWDHNEQQDEIEECFQDWSADFSAVETTAYQAALFQDLIRRGIPCRPFTAKRDKIMRASGAAIWHANGKVYFLKDAEWLPELQKELYKFPKAAHDDMVDALSLAAIVVRSRGPLSDDETDDDIPDPIEGRETGVERSSTDLTALRAREAELRRMIAARRAQLSQVHAT